MGGKNWLKTNSEFKPSLSLKNHHH